MCGLYSSTSIKQSSEEKLQTPGQQVTGSPSFLRPLVPLFLEPSAPFLGLFAFMMSRTGKWLITIVPQSLENFLKQAAHCLTCCCAQVSKTPGEEARACGNAALVSQGPAPFLQLSFYLNGTKKRCTRTAIETVLVTVLP